MTNSKRKSSASAKNTDPASSSVSEKKAKRVKEETEEELSNTDAVESPAVNGDASVRSSGRKPVKKVEAVVKDEEESRFVGEPVAADEARQKWPHRYLGKNKTVTIPEAKGSVPPKEYIQAKRHFTEALVDGRVLFKLGDDGYVQAGEGEDYYICRIVEMFEGVDGEPYFCAQWFYRAKDTVIQACSNFIDDKRIFLSEIKDDNPLDCLIEKLKIVRVPLDVDVATKRAMLANGDYYYDMSYLVPFSTYQNLPPDNEADGNESDSTISSESDSNVAVTKVSKTKENKKPVMRMLDLYSGCGAMSTGLCLGANMADVNLVTRWAVDLNKYACESLKLNHPETEARNESAEDFLLLLKEWEKLCQSFSLVGGGDPITVEKNETENAEDDEEEEDDDDGQDEEVFEVEKVLSICYGDPKEMKKRGLYLKIRWKNYGPEEDTWEPIDGLGDCQDKIKQFVVDGFNSKILPLPGDVDVICGGPPCQGISGFNRFRNKDNPLDDEKNKQLVVYMDIVEYLKPRFCLMENVVDIVKFAKGFLGRYALGRLVSMNYQARIGLMTAGSYGLPQFRMRMFMWGARPNEKLPQYPLPTHNVVTRGVSPVEFESNTVVHDDVKGAVLEKELFLGDAISDLPPVTNDEERDEIPYKEAPKTEFQKFISLKKKDMPGFVGEDSSDHLLYDHRPYKLNEDDYQRVCQIPKKKGANFRDLKGVRVRDDNRVEWDPNVERVYLPSGKPLVPDYAMSFVEGRSLKPFGRLWWDEIVPTVVTRAEPHNQAILHPLQDRVLTIRENARLQGFPDYYKLLGPIKERYMQVGNAVAVPVARALGYSLAMSCKGAATEGPVYTLPKKFPNLEAVAVEEN
ncbi:putative DNA (cytosine-5-)-methyltransferase [Helianthus annuus]|uniref:Cytosine-specific methyltransferase n=1 Tax=Helianthus annuus TaxID=4232 RepID=A0A251S955_HELAN|nr:DNA (cytosine-5)-methyltransferase CMT3 [Helianthus annuus]KAF5764472.1 putative DNA (cytosine-5-)-methyltransferase [Helianthus annuus]KAJ0451137.1 putative DNA (cytosine-5-)-methyltransferase [Helianthus annuus]KAJ0455554.1 putative DNA (cytosine-5-)-methyltransferase [Helianthus annuus]KAJ0473008.1 putative DNA (cytosine-5-)-methyltransferase [Helianthus annuus]KAJ0648611.1 putative DNA (cytosine-5-)-methyltransferase [Helianthus annuus]